MAERPWLGWCVPRRFQPPRAGFPQAVPLPELGQGRHRTIPCFRTRKSHTKFSILDTMMQG